MRMAVGFDARPPATLDLGTLLARVLESDDEVSLVYTCIYIYIYIRSHILKRTKSALHVVTLYIECNGGMNVPNLCRHIPTGGAPQGGALWRRRRGGQL